MIAQQDYAGRRQKSCTCNETNRSTRGLDLTGVKPTIVQVTVVSTWLNTLRQNVWGKAALTDILCISCVRTVRCSNVAIKQKVCVSEGTFVRNYDTEILRQLGKSSHFSPRTWDTISKDINGFGRNVNYGQQQFSGLSYVSTASLQQHKAREQKNLHYWEP
jgi:hypothetical protein